MSNIKKIIILSIGLILTYCNIYAANFGKTGREILNIYSSAKIAAMGNANVGLANDLSAIAHNPAGLTQLDGTEIEFSHLIYFLDTSMNSFTFGKQIGNIGVALKGKFFIAADTIRDTAGIESEKFDIKYMQYSFGIGVPVFNKNSLGLTINSINEKIYNDSGTALSVDFGWHFKTRNKNSFGFVIRNVGTKGKILEDEIDLPLKYVLGGAHGMGRFMFTWEVYTGKQIDFAWQSGLQVDFNGVKLRGGFISTVTPDITFGFGVPFRTWQLDYAFSPHQDLGVAHRISFGVNF